MNADTSEDTEALERLLDVSTPAPRTFEYKGVKVDEFVVPWKDGKVKLVWVKSGFLRKLVDDEGKPIPLFHFTFDTNPDPETRLMKIGRRRVSQLFNEHYFPNTQPTYDGYFT